MNKNQKVIQVRYLYRYVVRKTRRKKRAQQYRYRYFGEETIYNNSQVGQVPGITKKWPRCRSRNPNFATRQYVSWKVCLPVASCPWRDSLMFGLQGKLGSGRQRQQILNPSTYSDLWAPTQLFSRVLKTSRSEFGFKHFYIVSWPFVWMRSDPVDMRLHAKSIIHKWNECLIR